MCASWAERKGPCAEHQAWTEGKGPCVERSLRPTTSTRRLAEAAQVAEAAGAAEGRAEPIEAREAAELLGGERALLEVDHVRWKGGYTSVRGAHRSEGPETRWQCANG